MLVLNVYYFSELFHRPNRLKERLQSTIPDLIFKGSKSAKDSLMVYHEDTDLSSALPHSMMTSLTSIEQDTESEEESFNLDCAPYSLTGFNQRDLYHTAKGINRDICEVTPKMNWPPQLSELNLASCQKYVPVNLYNLLAIITGVSDALDVPEDGQYMKLESNSHKRILSLSQDIVSLTTKGRVITPKAIACGMTLRHYSGQKSVSSLIAGLGHSVGYHTLLRMETPSLYRKQGLSI